MKKLLSSGLLLLAALIWGFAFSAQKVLDTFPVFALTALRSIIAAIFLLFVIVIFDKCFKTGRRLFGGKRLLDFNKSELIGGVVCGSFLGVASLFQQFGLSSGADAGKAAFITALYVVLVPVLGLILKKRCPAKVWLCVVIAVVGFYFLCIKDGFSVDVSDLLVLTCAFIFAGQILSVDHFLPKCDGVRLSAVQFFTCAILCGTLSLIFERGVEVSFSLSYLLPILYLGIGSSGIAYTAQILGQRGTNPAVSSILLSLESVFGVIGSALLLGERMTGREYLGCFIVFVAVILSQIDIPKREKENK